MKEDRIVDTSAFFTDISEHETECKSVDSLNPVHMKQTEQESLHHVCQPEWYGFACKVHRGTAEDEFLADRGKQYGIKQHRKCDRGIESGGLQKLLILVEPLRESHRYDTNQIAAEELHTRNKQDDTGKLPDAEGALDIRQIYTAERMVIPHAKDCDTDDRVYDHDDRAEICVQHQIVECLDRGGFLWVTDHKCHNRTSHEKQRGCKLYDHCQNER